MAFAELRGSGHSRKRIPDRERDILHIRCRRRVVAAVLPNISQTMAWDRRHDDFACTCTS